MAQELVAFRLYAPYFGYSMYVWGSMISVVMAALALGYGIGGWGADRSETDLPIYVTIAGSAVYQLGVLFTFHWMLPIFAREEDFTGTVLATLVVFAPSMTAMAAVSPFIIRLMAQSGHIGSIAGKIYALSTVGSIGGILITSFFLVPRFGTRKTLEVIFVASALTGVAGLARKTAVTVLAFVVILATARIVPVATWPASTIWAEESLYNLVRVVRSGDRLILKLNDEGGVHTIRNESTGWTGQYYDDFALGPLLVPAHRLLVLGMAGGGSIVATRSTAPEVEIDAVEIDAKVVEAATRFFGMNADDKSLHIHIADARPWLAKSREKYDVVHVDLYQGGPYIPFYLITVEFFQTIRAHMSDDGLLMMNLFDMSKDHELLLSVVATLKTVFPSVAVLPVGKRNFMVLGFSRETPITEIRGRLDSFAGSPVVKRMARIAKERVTELDVPPETIVFTDDFSPIERMTRRMLSGGSTR